MSNTTKSEKRYPKERLSRKERRALRRTLRTTPVTCPQCKCEYDDQDRDATTLLLLQGGKRGEFCSAKCIRAFVMSEEGAKQVLFRPFFKACLAALPYAWEGGGCCIQCEKNADLKWGDDDDADADIKALKHELDEAYKDRHVRRSDKRSPDQALDDWHKFGRKLVEALGARLPAYQLPFTEILGGYDSLVDGTYLLCSIECICALTERKEAPSQVVAMVEGGHDELLESGSMCEPGE